MFFVEISCVIYTEGLILSSYILNEVYVSRGLVFIISDGPGICYILD